MEMKIDFEKLERFVLLKVVDSNWMNHIDDMQIMKNEIFARGFGNQDPILAYKKDAYEMFDNMIEKIRETTCVLLLNTSIEVKRPEPKPMQVQTKFTEAKVEDVPASRRTPAQNSIPERPQEIKKQTTIVNTEKKIGRNDPCPCGSGKKYKNCHGANV